MNKKQQRPSPLESGLIEALQAIDNQIAREMQRTPQELETHGVQKWEPYNKRIEAIATFLLERLGEQEIQLDALLVLSQATSKALSFLVQDLGKDGLGAIRTSYCLEAFKKIDSDTFRALQVLKEESELM